jgi:uncharacterized phage protein (TIGR01671 family)
MKKIKFRTWSKEEGLMTKPFDLEDFATDQDSEWGDYNYYNPSTADDFVFMQYTGLHDKNGKEIYEGDVVGKKNPDWLNGFSGKYEIKFGVECIDDYGNTAYGYGIPDKEHEVIGNVWENGELLNDSK